jgi:phosphate starvation-inducible PhoH-like protein
MQTLYFPSPQHLLALCGGAIDTLFHIEKALGLQIVTRDHWLTLEGPEPCIQQATQAFQLFEALKSKGLRLRPSDCKSIVKSIADNDTLALKELWEAPLVLHIQHKTLIPKTLSQKRYLELIFKKTIVFGSGPAGTGKTYLAVAMALQALLAGKVQKILLTRPAVESGEALGFLPGDLQEKILPYLRPLYDAMDDLLGPQTTQRLMEQKVIEIAPLAYMRGRTLSNAFVILDEAQNTTHEQMLMFLTRLGEGSQMVITGDLTQTDLPRQKVSGLKEALARLQSIQDIGTFHFEPSDVIRHPLVQKIVEAYK